LSKGGTRFTGPLSVVICLSLPVLSVVTACLAVKTVGGI
jgi:hypothetical protein